MIPLTKPYWGKKEIQSVTQALYKSDGVGDGIYTAALIAYTKKITGAQYAYAVPSCTHGLELACRAVGIGIGDEVIVPSFTLSSTANCVVLTGARPVFADIDKATYCIDPSSIERQITKKTKGIIVVHYAGMSCDMMRIKKIAKQHKLFIIEDAAHCIGAYYKGKMLGTLGDIGVFSFHGTKNVCSGEGGMVVTNTKKLADRMDIFRANGTNRSAFLDHRVSLYTWVGPGSSFLMSDILAALLLPQLHRLSEIARRRTRIAMHYMRLFKGVSCVHLPIVPTHTTPNWHIFAIRFDTAGQAKTFSTLLKERGITAVRHYVPLHSSPMGRKLSGKQVQSLPVTEAVAETLVRLPIYPNMNQKEEAYVAKTIKQVASMVG